MIRPTSSIGLNRLPLIWVAIDMYIPTLCSTIWFNLHKLTIITFKNRVDIKTNSASPSQSFIFEYL